MWDQRQIHTSDLGGQRLAKMALWFGCHQTDLLTDIGDHAHPELTRCAVFLPNSWNAYRTGRAAPELLSGGKVADAAWCRRGRHAGRCFPRRRNRDSSTEQQGTALLHLHEAGALSRGGPGSRSAARWVHQPQHLHLLDVFM